MEKRQKTPSVILRAVLSGFLLGIFSSGFVFFDDGMFAGLFLFFSILITFVLSMILIRKFNSYDRIVLIFIVFSTFSFGLFLYSMSFPSGNSVQNYAGESYRITGTVLDVGHSAKFQKLTLRELEIGNQFVDDGVLVFVPIFPEFKYGDRISLRCDLENPEPFNGFRYDRFLASKDIYATCFSFDSPILKEKNQGNKIIAGLLSNREKMIKKIDSIFGEPHAALLSGLLLGEQDFSEVWEERFFKTGTTHIVAASGYNVAVVTFIMFGVLARLGFKRPRAFAFILGSIMGYVVLAGAEAAVVRAGVMGTLVLLSRQLGRKSTMMNVLLLTATVMLLVNPRLLRDDVGFQLSMLSTIALIYFAPKLEKKFRFIPEDFTIRESFVATLAATLFTFPLVIFQFKAFSIISPIVNLLILPLVPYAMFFGGIAVFVGFINVAIATILSGPAWALLSVVLFIVEAMSELPIAMIEYAAN